MNPDIAARYADERLPRYTSYPTAPHFSPMVGASTYERWLNGLPRGCTTSLYLHVPFCRSMCWYCGCNTTVAVRNSPIEDYLLALRQEIDLVASKASHRLTATHIHFGGGTPTIVPPTRLMELGELLRSRFDVATGAEWAIEIDPRTLTPDAVYALCAMGITRASLGVQSFEPRVQQAINRVQSFEQTAAAAEMLRGAGIADLSFDLIYGLPHETVASCLRTVSQCLTLRPGRFSVFGYAHVPEFKKHQQKIDDAALPGAAERIAQADAIAGALVDAGYVRIGMDHFALPTDRMATAQRMRQLHRNFQGYTTDASDALIGLGASAIGRLPQGYVQNSAAIRDYARRINAGQLAAIKGCRLNADDRMRGEIIERLMCDFEADLGRICAKHGEDAEAVLRSATQLAPLIADGIAVVEGHRLRVADDSRRLVRTVAAAFDAYRDDAPQRYSRAV